MPKPKNKMGQTVLKEVSTVGEGDNPHAHIVFFKTKNSGDESDEQAGKSGVTDKGVHMSALKKSLGLPDTATDAEVEAAVAKAVADLAKTQTDLETVTKAKETVDAALVKANADIEARDLEITKAKDAAGDESFVDADGETIRKSVVGGSFTTLKKMNDRLVTAELTVVAKSNYPNIAGKPEDLVPLLRIAKSAPKADGDAITAFLKSHDEISALALKKNGSSEDAKGGDEGEDKIDKLAKARAADKGETYSVAYDAITKTAEGQEILRKSREAA